MVATPRASTLFPYTTLFRSLPDRRARGARAAAAPIVIVQNAAEERSVDEGDRKSTRLNSSHTVISYAVFCLKKKKTHSWESGRRKPALFSRIPVAWTAPTHP